MTSRVEQIERRCPSCKATYYETPETFYGTWPEVVKYLDPDYVPPRRRGRARAAVSPRSGRRCAGSSES